MKTRNLLAAAVAISALLAAPYALSQDAAKAAPKPGTWAHDTSDIAPDPDVTWGVLENGLRYAIMPNAEPPQRVSLRLYVDAGSLMEADSQQGLAHFIEHMAFNGTENFPAGEMVEYFQRLGMSFGGDTNAHTSFNETVYKLELPKAEAELLDRSMLLFRDYADRMLMSKAEIEKERGVILSELITRDSAEWRTQKEAYKFALPDSLISVRFPIGVKPVIKGADRDTFMNYYQKWYTSDRMAVVAVGDITAEQLVPLIKKHFGGMEKPEKPVADPDLGKITVGRGAIAKTHYEKEATETSISIEAVGRTQWQPDDTARNIHETKLALATDIIDNRLSELAKAEGAPFTGGGSYAMDFLNFAKFASIYVSCEPDHWEAALAVADQEIRRALEHGFTKAEFDEVTANLRNAYEQDLRSAASRKSRGLADQLVDSVSEAWVFTSPKQDLEWLNEHIGSLTAESCHAALVKAWQGTDRQLFVGGNLSLKGGEKAVLAAYGKSSGVPVKPPVEEETAAFAYTDFGAPGEVVERKHHEDIGVTQLRFANNVRLNLKQTDFEKDSISISIRIGGGELTSPKDKPGLAIVAGSIFDAGGLEKHSADELRKIFAGKTLGGSFGVGDDALLLSGGTNQRDLQEAMQMLTAYLVAPGYRPEALRQLHNNLDPIYTQIAHTPMGVMQDLVDPFLKGDDFRAGFPEKEQLMARTEEEVKAWLAEPLKTGYLEIGVVGDFEEKAVVEAVATTLGALPKRESTKPGYAEARVLHFPEGGQTKRFEFESEIPKAMVAVYWPTTDRSDIGKARRLSTLGMILGDRLRKKVREELGEAYSPFAHHMPSDTYTDYGYIGAMITVDPPQAEKIVAVVQGIGDELSAKGTSEDELQRTVKPLLTSLTQQVRSNGYWLGSVIGASQEHPERLDWARTMEKDFSAISVEEVNALAKEFLAPGRAVRVMVVPKAPKPAEKAD